MSMKTFATFAIIIGCFAILYPKFLHPMMSRLFGLQNGSSQYYPPGRRPEERRPPHMLPSHAGDGRQQMRPGPHPGMRAAAEIHRQQSQHGSGRGMMGIVLPMYAVGIVLYLVYTLVKVFGKKDKSLPSGDNYQSQLSGYTNPLSHSTSLTPQQKTKELQNLLLKADEKSISNEEMKELQLRLEETEAQMSQILQAMQLVQNKMDTPIQEQSHTCQEQKRKSPDSSPDQQSYEKVKKKGSNVEQKQDTNAITVESIGAKEGEVEQSAQKIAKDADGPVEEGREAGTGVVGSSNGKVKEEQGNGSGVTVSRAEDDCALPDDQVNVYVAEGGCPVEEEQCEEVERKCQEEDKVILLSEENSNNECNVRYRQIPPQSSH